MVKTAAAHQKRVAIKRRPFTGVAPRAEETEPASLQAAAAGIARPGSPKASFDNTAKVSRGDSRRFAVVGPVVCDRIVHENRLVAGGTEQGSARALNLLGERVLLQGVVGKDPPGPDVARMTAVVEGYDYDFREVDRRTGLWLIGEVGKQPAIDERQVRTTADKYYAPEDVLRLGDLGHYKGLVIGASSVIYEPYRTSLDMLVAKANEAGTPTYCDPNFRDAFWEVSEKRDDEADILGWFRRIVQGCDLVRMNAGEAKRVTGSDDPVRAARIMTQEWGLPMACVSSAENGAVIACLEHDIVIKVPALLASKVAVSKYGKRVDATGAGDAQLAGLIVGLIVAARILGRDLSFDDLSPEILGPILVFASAVAAVSIQGWGSIPDVMWKKVGWLMARLRILETALRGADLRGDPEQFWEVAKS